MSKDFMRIKEASQLLGVTPLTLRNWDKKGLLAAYRHPVNNYRLYRASDISDLLSRLQRPTVITPNEARRSAPRVEGTAIAEAIREPEVLPPPVQKLEVIFEDEV